jgi:hypothetical protein
VNKEIIKEKELVSFHRESTATSTPSNANIPKYTTEQAKRKSQFFYVENTAITTPSNTEPLKFFQVNNVTSPPASEVKKVSLVFF